MLIRPRGAERFVETSSARFVASAFQLAMKPKSYPALVLGPAGTGKTTALMHYSDQYNAIYCHADSSAKTGRGLFELLLESAGWRTTSTFYRELQSIAASRLEPWGNAQGRAIVVDEVQKVGLEGLLDLLALAETCRCPLVLAGNDKRLARSTTHDFALEQITSRLGTTIMLDKPEVEDCRAITEACGVTDRAAALALANFGSHTSLRDLDQVIQLARDAGGDAIGLRHVEYAVMVKRGGDRKALNLLEAA